MKIMSIMGTRPEIIKFTSFLKELEATDIDSIIVDTGQHKDMSELAFTEFDIKPHYRLKSMKHNQSLNDITTSILTKIDKVIKKEKPDIIAVLGDTGSSFAGAISAYHNKITLLHIESGVRTYNKYNSFPEEGYRQMIDRISDYHTCQTEKDQKNLIKEGILGSVVVGNYSLDLLKSRDKHASFKKILITMHRREDWGKKFENTCIAIKTLADKYSDFEFVFVTHPNPKLKKIVNKYLVGINNVIIKNNMGFNDFINELVDSFLVMTDSGGLFQEATFLNKPVIYLRTDYEYSEACDDVFVIQTGKDAYKILEAFDNIMSNDISLYKPTTIFGDGNAGKKTVEFIKRLKI